MIICAGTITIDPKMVDTFEKLTPAHVKRTMEQEFCHLFSLGVENRETGVITVAEIWKDEASLVKHHEQPFTKAYVQGFGGVKELNVKMYQVASAHPIPEGIGSVKGLKRPE